VLQPVHTLTGSTLSTDGALHLVMVCASMKLPLQQSVVKDGVVGSEDEDDVEPSFGKELAAVVLDYVATFGQRFFQLI